MADYSKRRIDKSTNPGRPPMPPPPPGSFLALLTDSQRDSLLSLGSNIIYHPRQTMMREGKRGDVVIVILQGLAKVTVLSVDGKEILLGFRSSGEMIGEMAVLSINPRPRSATVIAATELFGVVIKASTFVSYLERSPQVANRVSDMMAGKLRAANRRRLEFNAYPAETRVACVLAEVASAHGHHEGTFLRIGPEITQADLASLASTSVRTIEKVLSALESDHIVTRRRRDLIVADLAALRARCGSGGTIRPRRDC